MPNSPFKECSLDIHLKYLQAYGPYQCEYNFTGVEVSHRCKVLLKWTPSTSEHPFATNYALKQTTTPLTFFFNQKHPFALDVFAALQQRSQLLCAVGYERFVFLLHSQVPLACITHFNGLSRIFRFPNVGHVCMCFAMGWWSVVVLLFPKRFACPIGITRLGHGFIAILRWWRCFDLERKNEVFCSGGGCSEGGTRIYKV